MTIDHSIRSFSGSSFARNPTELEICTMKRYFYDFKVNPGAAEFDESTEDYACEGHDYLHSILVAKILELVERRKAVDSPDAFDPEETPRIESLDLAALGGALAFLMLADRGPGRFNIGDDPLDKVVSEMTRTCREGQQRYEEVMEGNADPDYGDQLHDFLTATGIVIEEDLFLTLNMDPEEMAITKQRSRKAVSQVSRRARSTGPSVFDR